MSGLTSTPYDWVRQISPELLKLDETPLWGSLPDFSWDAFISHLSKNLQVDSLEIKAQDVSWKEPPLFLEGMGENPSCLAFAAPPLMGQAIWIFPERELVRLMALMLNSGKEEVQLLRQDASSGFHKFLGIEVANAFQSNSFDKAIIPQLVEFKTLPDSPSLSIEISFSLFDNSFVGRLIIPQEMRQSLKERYAHRDLSVPLKIFETVEVTLQLLAGSTTLDKSEWNSSKPGDVLLLDSCSLQFGEDKGRVMIALNDLPIFRGKIKDGNVKILEYPLFHEEHTAMAGKDHDEDEDSDHESEFEHDDSFDEDSDEFTEDEEYTDEESEEDTSSMEEMTEESDIESDFDLDTEEETTEEEGKAEEEDDETHLQSGPQAQAPANGKSAIKPLEKKETSSLVKVEELPITVVVEVGRLKMTIQKLVELTPGNLLELDVHPENGVDLVVNGKCIGKGELLRIGETLGVRILDKI